MGEIKTSRGEVILVDDCDLDLSSFNWSFGGAGIYKYAIRNGKRYNERITMHGVIISRKVGRPLADGEIVDHINHDTRDNRRENLRIANHSLNAFNQHRKPPKSGYRGVRKKTENSWSAGIKVMGKQISLGSFPTRELAAEAYNRAALQYAGEFAVLNVIMEPKNG